MKKTVIFIIITIIVIMLGIGIMLNLKNRYLIDYPMEILEYTLNGQKYKSNIQYVYR